VLTLCWLSYKLSGEYGI